MTAPLPTDPGTVGAGYQANGVFSYQSVAGGAGTPPSVAVRVCKLEHSWEVIYKESHGRINRAFYPHQRAPARFAVTLELNGYAEQKPFMDFMFAYIQSFVGDQKNGMFVSVPVRNFARWGIPVQGVFQGDHVGSMVFKPTIVFETLHDEQDPTIFTGDSTDVSHEDNTGDGTATQWFYPFSPGNLSPNLTAESLYNFSNPSNSFAGAVAQGISGVIQTIAGNVGAAGDAAQRIIDQQRRNGQGGL